MLAMGSNKRVTPQLSQQKITALAHTLLQSPENALTEAAERHELA